MTRRESSPAYMSCIDNYKVFKMLKAFYKLKRILYAYTYYVLSYDVLKPISHWIKIDQRIRWCENHIQKGRFGDSI